jgi:hypothetical protein
MNTEPQFTDHRGRSLVTPARSKKPSNQWTFRRAFIAGALIVLVPLIAFGAVTVTQVELTTQVKGILPSANGGTASAFFTVSGPATSAKTFTFPNASSTVLTSNAAVTVAQGGTGVATLAAHGLVIGEGTSNVAVTATGTTGQCFIGQTGADPIWGSCGGVTPVYSEVPSGTINGSTTSFTLANTPTAGSVALYKNGQRQTAGGSADYTISGATITYNAAPLTGDTLLADYTH